MHISNIKSLFLLIVCGDTRAYYSAKLATSTVYEVEGIVNVSAKTVEVANFAL